MKPSLCLPRDPSMRPGSLDCRTYRVIFALAALAMVVMFLDIARAAESRYRIIHRFQGGSDGLYPSGIVAGRWGTLWGSTQEGGTYGYGTVFKLVPPE